ncbi:MAG: hypothetical protein QM767_21895 [Anaeromyxobacter sp.]
MEEFFQSVAREFAENRSHAGAVQVAILVLLGALALVQVVSLVRRRSAFSSAFQREAAQRGLSAQHQELLTALAQEGTGAGPVDRRRLLSHYELFEAVTVRWLAAHPPGGGNDLAAALREIRHLLGFDRLPAHTPLLSSRELPPGTAVEAVGGHGEVSAVDERAWTIELRAPATLAAGATLELGLAHAREARYALSCLVLQAGPGAEGEQHLVLAHDEAPRRIPAPRLGPRPRPRADRAAAAGPLARRRPAPRRAGRAAGRERRRRARLGPGPAGGGQPDRDRLRRRRRALPGAARGGALGRAEGPAPPPAARVLRSPRRRARPAGGRRGPRRARRRGRGPAGGVRGPARRPAAHWPDRSGRGPPAVPIRSRLRAPWSPA